MLDQLLEGAVFYVAFLFAVTLHEAGHAWAAKIGGDLTAYYGGQVSLDPIPHIRREPFGMVVLPILSVILTGWPFGYASAPYDPNWARRHPKRAGWMALAGPGANLLLVLLAAFVITVGRAMTVFTTPSSVFFSHVTEATSAGPVQAVAFVVSVFFSLNLVLLILNLIPVPPLDGYGALPLVLPAKALEAYQDFSRQPMIGWIGILIAWRIFGSLYHPIFLFAVNLLYPGARYG
ncbi:MAG: site-2 protease family protein [Acidobacteria bacterium]|nr:site-2 protease family protein [Acidobacteriota bacterium]